MRDGSEFPAFLRIAGGNWEVRILTRPPADVVPASGVMGCQPPRSPRHPPREVSPADEARLCRLREVAISITHCAGLSLARRIIDRDRAGVVLSSPCHGRT